MIYRENLFGGFPSEDHPGYYDDISVRRFMTDTDRTPWL